MNRTKINQSFSQAMFVLCCACAGAMVLTLGTVLFFVLKEGVGALSVSLFTQDVIAEGLPGYPGGLKHAILGTLTLLGMACCVGIPIGMLTGVFLSEYTAENRLAGPVRFVADVLAGVPSIVVGILGYELLVVPFASGKVVGVAVPGLERFAGIGSYNAYAGALALAFIMIPIVARTTEEMLKLVPGSYREASIALGASKASTIVKVVLPAATGPTVTGIMLAIARAAGETAPLLFTIAGASALSSTRGPFPSLTLQIFQHITGQEPARRLAWAGVLVLVSLIFAINLAVRFATRKSRPLG
jgi:phosphate transport system permease protein